MSLHEDFPELAMPAEHVDVSVKLTTVPLTTDLIPILKPLTRDSCSSGMNCWLRTLGTNNREWIGLSPSMATIAYKFVDNEWKAIGWCALGNFNTLTSVIGTFVAPSYRKNGIAAMLVREALREHKGPRLVVYDNWSWNIAHIIKSCGFDAATVDQVNWSCKVEIAK